MTKATFSGYVKKILLLQMIFFTIQTHAGDLYNSVTEFGAKGDGVTDDTDAILRAIAASNQRVISAPNIPGVYPGPIYFGCVKTVFFPSGLYKISKPLNVGSYISIKGDKAILFPDIKYKAKSVAFIGDGVWLSHFEGLQFLGFNKAIQIVNPNTDCGKVEIEDCDFLTNEIAITIGTPSSYLYIHNNRFNNNQKAAIINAAQKTDFSDNWITSGTLKGVQDAQIINKSLMHFDKNVLVPINPAVNAVEPAWINNYGSIFINGTRQGGESGSFTLVNNFAKAAKSPFWPNAVMINQSECYAIYGNEKGYFQPAALRLIEIPNNIVLENLVGFIDCKLMDFSRKNNPSMELKKADANTFVYKVTVQNIQGTNFKHPNGSDVPDDLVKYLVK